MERIIRVTGKGMLSVTPDTTRLILSLEGTEYEYNDALRLSSEKTDCLKRTLEAFGFTRQDLKTTSFGVDAVYESYQANDHSWKNRFEGYKFSHRLKVEFPSDNARLGKILYALGRCDAKPEIRIEYTVSDPETVKNQLLAKAAADSKAKAAILSETSGVKLGEIVTIDYSWAEMELVTRPMNRMLTADAPMAMACSKDSYNIDIEADDIEVSDTVTVVWEIH